MQQLTESCSPAISLYHFLHFNLHPLHLLLRLPQPHLSAGFHMVRHQHSVGQRSRLVLCARHTLLLSAMLDAQAENKGRSVASIAF